MVEQQVTKARLVSLERTVDVLTGRLQDVQGELQRVKGDSLTERLWKNLTGSRQRSEFMSACCNRRVRPNMRMVDHAGTTYRY
jgi:hypothetical protein